MERPIRNLQVVEACFAGVGRHSVDLAIGLQQRGHPTALAYSSARMDARFVHGLERLRSIGGTTFDLGMTREVGRGDLGSFHALKRLASVHGPFDLIHGHSGKAGLLVRASRMRNVPVVYTPHAYITMATDLGVRRRRVYALAEKLLGHRGMTINVSEDERLHAITLGVAPKRLVVVPNGIEAPPYVDPLLLRRGSGIDPKAVVFGFVGRLDAQKNPLLLIESFARVDLPDARLVIVGEGALRDQAEARVAELGLQTRVIFLGAVDGLTQMAMFDVLVLSSDYEGLPYVLIEAAMSRLPIISTRVGGVGELVVDGENGRLVPVRDVTALAAALNEVGSDESLRRRMAQNSEKRAARFELHSMVEATLGVYAKVLGRNGAPPSGV